MLRITQMRCTNLKALSEFKRALAQITAINGPEGLEKYIYKYIYIYISFFLIL